MTDKEISEIRRRLKPDRAAATVIYGCFVNSQKQVVSKFRIPFATLDELTTERYFSLFKKSISGKFGKTLWNVSFATETVAHNEGEYAVLSNLLKKGFEKDDGAEAARDAFYYEIIESHETDQGYVILLIQDSYDVPQKRGKSEDAESENVFRYFVCAICPVPEHKADMQYDRNKQYFQFAGTNLCLKPPVFGAMFPAFDDRAANIYGACYYAKKKEDNGAELYQGIFGKDAPISVSAQTSGFNQVLQEAFDGSVPLDVLQNFSAAVRGNIDEAQTKNEQDGPLSMNGGDIKEILRKSGAPDAAAERAEKAFCEAFGEDASLPAGNLVDSKRVAYEAPFVRLTVDAGQESRIMLREQGGRKLLIVDVEGFDVTVNGVSVS